MAIYPGELMRAQIVFRYFTWSILLYLCPKITSRILEPKFSYQFLFYLKHRLLFQLQYT